MMYTRLVKHCRSSPSNFTYRHREGIDHVRRTSRCNVAMVIMMMEHVKYIEQCESITTHRRHPYAAPPVQTPSHRTLADQRSQTCQPHLDPQKRARLTARRRAWRWAYVVGGKMRATIRMRSMADGLVRAQASLSNSVRVKEIAVAAASEPARELAAQRGCSTQKGCSTCRW
jgi:hypothetical protein